LFTSELLHKMKRKVLQHIANTLMQILVGPGLHKDLEILAEIPDGRLTIDLLNQSVQHDIGGSLNLQVINRLSVWLNKELEADKISAKDVQSVNFVVDIRTDRIPTDKRNIIFFEFSGQGSLVTSFGTYVGTLKSYPIWYHRAPLSLKT
jgi:hypothetical protein